MEQYPRSLRVRSWTMVSFVHPGRLHLICPTRWLSPFAAAQRLPQYASRSPELGSTHASLKQHQQRYMVAAGGAGSRSDLSGAVRGGKTKRIREYRRETSLTPEQAVARISQVKSRCCRGDICRGGVVVEGSLEAEAVCVAFEEDSNYWAPDDSAKSTGNLCYVVRV